LQSVVAEHPAVDLATILQRRNLSLADIDRGDYLPSHDDLIFVLSQLNKPDVIPGVVLLYGRKLDISDLGILAYAIVSSGTVRQALEVMIRFNRLTTGFFNLALSEERRRATITHWIKSAYLRYEIEIAEESISGMWHVFAMLLPDSTDFARFELRFSFPAPAYAAQYDSNFECQIHFDEPQTSISFPREWLDLPIESANETMAGLVRSQCEAILAALGPGMGIIEDVRRVLLARPKNYLMILQETAEALYISSRTLERRLAESGTCFRRISSELRMQLAQRYLQRSTLTPQEIAYLLGYSQPSAFYRAFKRWHSMTPNQCRSQREETRS